MPGLHSRLGPSGAHRWLRCAASPAAEDEFENVSGFFAAEGTAFHEWAADCLEFGLEPEDIYGAVVRVESGWVEDEDGNPVFLDPEIPDPDDEDADEADILTGEVRRKAPDFYEFVMDSEFARHMRPGLEQVRQMATGALLFVETKVDTSPWCGPGNFGTSDVAIIDIPQLEIVCFDWKYGAGVPISPIENEQARLYVLGVWQTIAAGLFEEAYGHDASFSPDDIRVRIIIEQPRAPAGGGEWETTMGDVLRWGEFVRERADMTRDPLAERTPGEKQCSFCRARVNCGDFSKYLLDMARIKFDDLKDAMDDDYAPPMPQPHDLSPEERAFIHRNASLFRKWLDSIHESLVRDYMHDRPTPGLKMIMGNRGHRAYIPEDLDDVTLELAVKLGPDAYTKKLITPAQAQKKLSQEDYEKLSSSVRQNEGKPTLVSEYDARPAIPTLKDRFDDLPDEDDEENK